LIVSIWFQAKIGEEDRGQKTAADRRQRPAQILLAGRQEVTYSKEQRAEERSDDEGKAKRISA